MSALLRGLRYGWAAPASTVGIAVAACAWCAGAQVRRRAGVLEVSGGRAGRLLRLLPAARRIDAITLGHVVIGREPATLDRLRVHEHVHVRQYERWGVLFFVLYAGSSAVQWLRGRDPYRDNRFEREAFAVAARATGRGVAAGEVAPEAGTRGADSSREGAA